MKEIELLCGVLEPCSEPLSFFSDAACSFISDLSHKIMEEGHGRQYPDLAALAFFGRKANLRKLANMYPERENRLGRGLCFHVAPGNIPINFAFSFFFALLAGNANIVRLPGKDYPQNQLLCRLMAEIISGYPQIRQRTALVRYPRNDAITAKYCAIADARMLWGGDGTVAHIKAIPAKPACVDLAFIDRYSLAIINGNAILELDEAELSRLAISFFNDTYLMDQNACSSPQLILWENDSKSAREKFWNAVTEYAQKRYEIAGASAVDKLTWASLECIANDNLLNCIQTGNLLYRLQLAKAAEDIAEQRGNCGYFHECELKDWRDLLKIIDARYQTITYFGIDADSLRIFLVESHCPGIDRIVPVGKAMDIGPIWDGHDLPRELSRLIAVN